MSGAWPLVKLGDVLSQVTRRESVDPAKNYQLLGVRLDGKGPFLRETVMGSQSAAASLFKVRVGDFIYSRLFAWRGAFGVIPADLDGSYVSNEFPAFVPRDDRIDVSFLRYWFRLPAVIARVEKDCSGGTPLTRNRYKERFFLGLEIPLPSMEEQRRIVARLDSFRAKSSGVDQSMESAAFACRKLLIAMARRADLTTDARVRQGWRRGKLGEVLQQVTDEHLVRAVGRYPNFGIYSYARGLFPKPPIEGIGTSAIKLNRVREGQFIYSRLFAFEGAYGMVGPDLDGFFVSAEYPTFECDRTRMEPEFLVAYFQAPDVWAEIAAGSKGLGDRRQRVQPARLLDHELDLPPLRWQERIAAAMSAKNRVDKLRGEAAAELDALMPSLLDRAFRGEL